MSYHSCMLASDTASLRDGPRHGGVSHAPFPSDCSGALPLGHTLASDASLQIGQLGLPAHVHTPLAGCGPTLVSPLHYPMALVLCHGRQERDEAPPDRRGEIQVRLVEHLDHGTPRV